MCFFAICTNKVEASTYYNTEVGKTFNCVTSPVSSLSVNDSYYVFDLDKLYSNYNLVTKNVYESQKLTNFSSNVSEFSKNLSINAGLDEEYADMCFKINMSSSLGYAASVVSKQYKRYYSYLDYTATKTASLSNIDSLKNMYSTTFMNRVNSAISSNSMQAFINLFNDYGTHIILKGTYGTMVEKDAFIMCNEDITESISASDITSKVSNSTNNSEFNSELSSYLHSKNENLKCNTKYYSTSGLISCESNVYRPIWYYMDSNKQEILSSKFKEYTLYMQSKNGVYQQENYMNAEERVVTDSSVTSSSQPKDEISLNSKYLEYYSKITLIINVNTYQVDKGYSYIYVYNGDQQISKTPDLGLAKDKKWREITVSFDINKLAGLTSILLRYGASGLGSDDWKIKDLNVQLFYYN